VGFGHFAVIDGSVVMEKVITRVARDASDQLRWPCGRLRSWIEQDGSPRLAVAMSATGR
jgi:hypothetical protein